MAIDQIKAGLTAAVDKFFDQYSSTLELAEELIQSKSRSQEVLILLCSRLDALACNSVPEDEPRQRAFTRLITDYAKQRNLFESVSLGDFYYELSYHRWLLPGMIEKAGRLRAFSRLNEPFIKLIDESGIALTERDAHHLLSKMMRALEESFRVKPGQPRRKRSIGTIQDVTKAIMGKFQGIRSAEIRTALRTALKHVLSSQTIASILYQRFRCEAIHGGRVVIDEERFFIESEPYWVSRHSKYYGSFLFIEFPAKFLANILRNCIDTYRQCLLRKGKLPPDVIFRNFDDDIFDVIELLDEELLPKTRSIGLRFQSK